MNVVLALVLAVAGLGVVTTLVRYPPPPPVEARLLAAVSALALIGFLGASGLYALVAVLHAPPIEQRLQWCSSLLGSATHPLPWLGAFAAVAFVTVVTRVVRSHRRSQQVLAEIRDGDPLEVIELDSPVAFAVPGRPGRVVVSSGLLRVLDGAERRAVIAHELSHLRHRHHRYVQLAELTCAALPVAAPLVARLRHAVERWADEDAVIAVGDRRVVARAIARVGSGVNGDQPAQALGASGTGVVARVDALLDDREDRWDRGGPASALPVLSAAVPFLVVVVLRADLLLRVAGLFC